jgi:hypothetical protein
LIAEITLQGEALSPAERVFLRFAGDSKNVLKFVGIIALVCKFFARKFKPPHQSFSVKFRAGETFATGWRKNVINLSLKLSAW